MSAEHQFRCVVTRTEAPPDPEPVCVRVRVNHGAVPPEYLLGIRVRVGGVEVPASVTIMPGAGNGLEVSFIYPPEGGDVRIVLPPPL